MKSFLSPLLALLLMATSAQAQQEYIRLNQSGRSLNVERGVLELRGTKSKIQSSQWEKISAGNGLFFLRNRVSGQYLVAASENTVTTTSQAPSQQGSGPHYWRYSQPSGNSQVSVLTTQSGKYLFNFGNSLAELQIEEVSESQPQTPPAAVEYRRLLSSKQAPLHVENGPPVFGPMDPGAPGCMWEVKEATNRGLFMMFTNRKTGQVLSSSGTTLTTQAPGPITTGQEPFYWRAVRNGDLFELTNSQGARLTGVSIQPVR